MNVKELDNKIAQCKNDIKSLQENLEQLKKQKKEQTGFKTGDIVLAHSGLLACFGDNNLERLFFKSRIDTVLQKGGEYYLLADGIIIQNPQDCYKSTGKNAFQLLQISGG